MALAVQQGTYTTGTNFTATLHNAELTEIYTQLNSITNAQIDSAAAIATSKLEVSSGTATPLILNNNVGYQGKDSGGTARTLLKLGTNDVFALGRFMFQGGSATNWATAGSGNTTSTGWTIIGGTRTVSGSSSDTINFGITFAGTPLCFAQMGSTTGTDGTWTVSAPGTTSFVIRNGHTSSRDFYWLAFGPVA